MLPVLFFQNWYTLSRAKVMRPVKKITSYARFNVLHAGLSQRCASLKAWE